MHLNVMIGITGKEVKQLKLFFKQYRSPAGDRLNSWTQDMFLMVFLWTTFSQGKIVPLGSRNGWFQYLHENKH